MSAQISGRVVLGEGCKVSAGAMIRGPAALGSGCVIGENAYIAGAVLWQKVHVGRGAQLDNCILREASIAGDGCRILQGSVLGNGVRVAAGSVLAPGTSVWPDGAEDILAGTASH